MILLDTCALIWLVSDQKKFSKKALNKIEDSAGVLFISAISAFEIGQKYRRGLLTLPFAPDEWFSKALAWHQIECIPINHTIALTACDLPPIHKDPADRIIIATAMLQGYKLITPDQHISSYPEAEVFW